MMTVEKALAQLHDASPELLWSCKMLISMIEDGRLVRDISKDASPDWAFKMMRFTMDLNRVTMAIAKAEGRE